MRRILLIALLLLPLSAWAEGGKRPQPRLSVWEAMQLWQGPPVRQDEPKQVAQEQQVQEQQKPKPHKKPKPCSCGAQWSESAVNYPPYDVEP